jgi:hypothetical protein
MNMNDIFKFGGRGRHWDVSGDAEAIQAEPGSVLCLVTTVCGVEFVTYYCRMAVINRWGMLLVNPFIRLQYFSLGHDYAEYLPRDMHVFSPARLEMIPEQEWMKRKC